MYTVCPLHFDLGMISLCKERVSLLGKSRSRDGKIELLFMEGTPIEIHQ